MNSFDVVRRPDNPHILNPRILTGISPQWPDSAREPQEFAGLLASWNLILAHKLTVLVYMLVCVAASVGFTMLQNPTFRARTALEVQPRNEYFLNLREMDPTLTGHTGETYLQTQTQIMQSEAVIKKALARMDTVPVPASPIQNLVRRYRPKATTSPAVEGTVSALTRNLSVHPRQGHVIEVTFEHPDARFAAGFLNALTAAFVEESIEARDLSGKLTQARLKDQLHEVKTQLASSEETLEDYARAAGLTLTSEKTSAAEDELRVLQRELATARADRIQKQAQREMAASSSAESLPPVLDNATLGDYQVKLMELRRQRADLRALFTPNHPEVRQIQAQILELEASLKSQRLDVVDRIRNEYQAAVHREALLAAAVEQQTKRVSGDSVNSVRYRMLQREVETNRALYDVMLQRARNALLASALETHNIRVIDAATVPLEPFKPHMGQNVTMAGIGGIVLGMLVVLVAEGKDRRIRSPLDLRSNIDVQQLAIVPYVQHPEQKAKPSVYDAFRGLGIVRRPNVHWSHDALADAFRGALTSLLAVDRNGAAPRIIVVTSPTTGDGKTTVVFNLGMALAEVKRRVLLIDADSRNPSLHRMFGIRNTLGFTDILKGQVEFSDSLLNLVRPGTPLISDSGESDQARSSAAGPGLYLLTAGSACENASTLFYRSDRLLGRLQAEFDAVLIDTPPTLHLPDARVLGRRSDGVILVLRSGQTSAILAREAAIRLENDYILTLGAVLNAFDWHGSPYNYYRRYPDPGRKQS